MTDIPPIEKTTVLTPKFDSNGLIGAIAQDAATGQILMFAYMNRQALEKTIRTGRVTYFSRSRGKLWTKGEQSGHSQRVEEILVDCDQDCLVIKVSAEGGQCHAGYRSCFYRRITGDGLEFVSEKIFDPDSVYKKIQAKPSSPGVA